MNPLPVSNRKCKLLIPVLIDFYELSLLKMKTKLSQKNTYIIKNLAMLLVS